MLASESVNGFAVAEVIRLESELAEAVAQAQKWERICKLKNRVLLGMGALLSVLVISVVAAVILWLRAVAEKVVF